MPQDWAADYAREQRENSQKLRLQIASDANYDPDHATRVFNVAAQTKLPSQVVAEDLEGLEEQLKRKSFNYDIYTDENNGSRIFNEFAAEDPYNFAVLERDRKSMTAFERAVDPIALGWDAGWGTTELAELSTKHIKGQASPEDEERMKELRSLLAGGDYGADSHFMKALVGTARQAPIQAWILGQAVDEAMVAGMAGALYGGIVGGGSTLGVGAIPGVAAGFTAGIGAGLLAGRAEAAFRLERGLAYDDYREMGIDDRDALLMANGVGAVNAALEAVGLGALTKRLPGFKSVQKNVTDKMIGEIFKTPKFSHAMAKFTAAYGEGMATEVVTEILQEATLMAAGEHLKSTYRAAGDMRPELDPMSQSQFWDAVKETAIQTMYGTVFLGAMGPITSLRSDYKRAQAARENQAGMAALGEAVDSAKTRDGDGATAWDEFVNRVKEKGPLKEIRVDAEGFREYWQSKQIDPDEAAKQLGIDLGEAEATDVDVVIPLDTYVKQIAGTEHHAGLMPNVRIREGDMTFNESEQWFKDSEKHIESLEAALKAEHDMTPNQEIADDVEAQLVPLYGKDAAKVQARIYSAMMTATAANANRDPMELHKERFVGVNRQVPDSLAGQDIDMQMDPLLDRIRNQDFPQQREIYGDSLFDMIRGAGGIQDEGGELAARDIQKQFPGLVSKTGISADEAAEFAQDRGYIMEKDLTEFMEAFDREAAGDQVFGRDTKVNTDLENLLAQLEEAERFFDEEQIDLNVMSNAEVRKFLKGMKTLEQSSREDLKEWQALVNMLANQQERLSKEGKRTDKVESILGRAEASRPLVADEQDFKNITFTDKFVTPSGKTGTAEISAQADFDAAVKTRKQLKKLLDCVNG